MRKSILTAIQAWAPAYARVTKARGGVNKLRSEAFATDEHGITRKRGGNPFPSFSRMRKSIFTARQEWTPAYARVTKAQNKKNKSFSPRRRKERKVKQEIRTCLMLLSVLSVLSVIAVKILGFGAVLLGRQEISWRMGVGMRWVRYQKKTRGY